MKVFKFGGASINSVERIQNLGSILLQFTGEKLVVIISAMGKTTNALEKVVEEFFNGKREEALRLFEQIKQHHLNTAKYVLVTHYLPCEEKLKDFFTEVEWLLHDKPIKSFDYYYDQVVCSGELFSTTIISAYLNEQGISNCWLDVRDIFRTNDDFRNAAIDWSFTKDRIQKDVFPLFSKNDIVLTQGFIGATDENESITLGREGSDFSAAVFANILNAESLTIWKDVKNVMNADPKQFDDAVALPSLSYSETVEMAYYGAQVIHPKTIKPLENKRIPLYVKCFLDPSLPGTVIDQSTDHNLPPIIILKENQVLIKAKSKDFSFAGDHYIGQLYQLFESFHLKPNLAQTGAISFLCVLDDWSEKIEKIALDASEFLDIQVIKGLTLLTIRHYNEEIFEKLIAGRKILLRQQTPETIQVVLQ